MARERMVTRTVNVTTVEVMALNVLTADVTYPVYELSGMYETQDMALKAVQKMFDTSELKHVTINHMVEREVLYGMSEVEFIKLAKILPPRTSKTE